MGDSIVLVQGRLYEKTIFLPQVLQTTTRAIMLAQKISRTQTEVELE
jgi:hypothetical protein